VALLVIAMTPIAFDHQWTLFLAASRSDIVETLDYMSQSSRTQKLSVFLDNINRIITNLQTSSKWFSTTKSS
jgi:hypothetical protein